jgi:prepilin-type N-terminal cleavage/methylation domain-containing protein
MSRRHPFRSRLGATRGYTAVEVLMAMTVMAIGASGVISMQKASIQGNLDARKTDVANSIARAWVERIKRDAMLWTQPGPSNPGVGPVGNLATAPLLNAGIGSAGTWFLPTQDIALTGSTALSPGFDILGRDLPLADIGRALFCTNVRMTWLVTNELIRVDVRVLWPRGITGSGIFLPAGGVCANAVATANAPDPLTYHSIYVTTAVRGNPQ